VFWDYFTSGCGGGAPALESRPRTSGAVVTVTSTATDFTLLRLTGHVPTGRTYAGWTTDAPPIGADVFGLHHPSGSHMRVSAGRLDRRDDEYHDVKWTSGVTEPGSSGSALLDSDGLVVGQLCCGDSSCANPSARDSYGRLDRAYTALQPFLDPAPGDDPQQPTYVDPFPFELDQYMRIELGVGEWARWTVDIPSPPGGLPRTPKLKIRVKGRRGSYARIVLPDSTEVFVSRNARARKISAPPGGAYRVELHSGLGDRPKLLAVRLVQGW
jgi:hypothetical protein